MTHPQSSVTCYVLGKAQSLSPELNPPRSPGGKRGLSNPLGLSPREVPAPAQHATPPLRLPGPVLLLPALPGPGFHAVLPPPSHGRHMLTIETRSSDPHEAKVLTVWIQSPEKNAQSPCELGRHRLNLPQQGAFLRHWHGHSRAQAPPWLPLAAEPTSCLSPRRQASKQGPHRSWRRSSASRHLHIPSPPPRTPSPVFCICANSVYPPRPG